MRLLTDVDGDEVSLVKRAANRRRFLLLKGGTGMDNDLSEILEVPWEREGALLDVIRKSGVSDENVERAVIAAVRLLKGVESEFSPELIEKLGTELYPISNPPLNTGKGTGNGGELIGHGSSEEDEDIDGKSSGEDTDGEASGNSLLGTGSGQKVAADDDEDEDDAAVKKSLSDPIANTGDLGDAIKLVEKSKDPSKARAFIVRRAKALGATGMLPTSWNVSKEEIEKAEDSLEGDVFIVDEERGTVETHSVPVQKEDGSWDFSEVPDESRPFYQALITKADETSAELAKTKEKLAKADETLLTRTMLEKAARYNHVAAVDDLAPILKEASQSFSEENFEKLEQMLASAEERVSKGSLFSEIGKAGLGNSDTGSDAYSKIVKKADELIEKSDGLTKEAAFDRAMRENPELYNEYLYEHGMGV